MPVKTEYVGKKKTVIGEVEAKHATKKFAVQTEPKASKSKSKEN